VSAERIGDQYNGPKGGWVEVVVSCHGAEDSARFDYASREWDEHDLRRSMHSWRWFDPARQADNVSVDVK
jgi:hypothetical protein